MSKAGTTPRSSSPDSCCVRRSCHPPAPGSPTREPISHRPDAPVGRAVLPSAASGRPGARLAPPCRTARVWSPPLPRRPRDVRMSPSQPRPPPRPAGPAFGDEVDASGPGRRDTGTRPSPSGARAGDVSARGTGSRSRRDLSHECHPSGRPPASGPGADHRLGVPAGPHGDFSGTSRQLSREWTPSGRRARAWSCRPAGPAASCRCRTPGPRGRRSPRRPRPRRRRPARC